MLPLGPPGDPNIPCTAPAPRRRQRPPRRRPERPLPRSGPAPGGLRVFPAPLPLLTAADASRSARTSGRAARPAVGMLPGPGGSVAARPASLILSGAAAAITDSPPPPPPSLRDGWGLRRDVTPCVRS